MPRTGRLARQRVRGLSPRPRLGPGSAAVGGADLAGSRWGLREMRDRREERHVALNVRAEDARSLTAMDTGRPETVAGPSASPPTNLLDQK